MATINSEVVRRVRPDGLEVIPEASSEDETGTDSSAESSESDMV